MALHGLCAQRPSHSLQIGGTTLPMDARMTGIYLGAAATAVVWLIAARRLRASPDPLVCRCSPFWRCLSSRHGGRWLQRTPRRSSTPNPSMNRQTCSALSTGVLAGNHPRSGAWPSLCKLDLGSRRSGASGRDESGRAPFADWRFGGDRLARALERPLVVCAICCWSPGRRDRRVLAAWDCCPRAFVGSLVGRVKPGAI